MPNKIEIESYYLNVDFSLVLSEERLPSDTNYCDIDLNFDTNRENGMKLFDWINKMENFKKKFKITIEEITSLPCSKCDKSCNGLSPADDPKDRICCKCGNMHPNFQCSFCFGRD